MDIPNKETVINLNKISMKSKSLLVAALLCGVFGVLSLQAQIPYKIKGTWQGGEGEKIYLKEIVSSDSIV